jgi:hypothetical protein
MQPGYDPDLRRIDDDLLHHERTGLDGYSDHFTGKDQSGWPSNTQE